MFLFLCKKVSNLKLFWTFISNILFIKWMTIFYMLWLVAHNHKETLSPTAPKIIQQRPHLHFIVFSKMFLYKINSFLVTVNKIHHLKLENHPILFDNTNLELHLTCHLFSPCLPESCSKWKAVNREESGWLFHGALSHPLPGLPQYGVGEGLQWEEEVCGQNGEEEREIRRFLSTRYSYELASYFLRLADIYLCLSLLHAFVFFWTPWISFNLPWYGRLHPRQVGGP